MKARSQLSDAARKPLGKTCWWECNRYVFWGNVSGIFVSVQVYVWYVFTFLIPNYLRHTYFLMGKRKWYFRFLTWKGMWGMF